MYDKLDGSSRWLCPDGKKCINTYKINNGEEDCSNGFDEKVIDYLPKYEGPYFRSYTPFKEKVWLCDNEIINSTKPCKGMCRNGFKPCNGQCIYSYIYGSTNTDECPPKYDYDCESSKPIDTSCQSAKGDACMFDQVWFCDGEVICSDTPCTSSGTLLCPSKYHLCKDRCQPDFVSCNKKCLGEGFLCENPQSQDTFFPNFALKRYLFDGQNYGKREETYVYRALLSTICNKLPSLGLDELCCLPPSSQCDGILECRTQNNRTVSQKIT